MRQLPVLRAAIAALVLLLVAAVPATAAPPDGFIAHYDYARVDIGTGGLWECTEGDAAGATMSISFAVGDHLQALGSRRPTTWTDADAFIEVFGCGGDYLGFAGGSHDFGGVFAPADAIIGRYEYARLDVEVPMYQDDVLTDVRVVYDLTWTATGAPMTVHPEGTGSERFASAVVNGTVTVTGLDTTIGTGWDGTLTFVVEDAPGALGRRVETVHP